LVTRAEGRTALMVHKPEWKEDHDLSWLDGSSFGKLSGDGNLLAFTEYSSAVGDQPVMCLRKTDGSPVVRLGVGRVWDLSKDGTKVLARAPTDPPQLIVQPTGPGEVLRLPRGPIETYLLGGFFPGADSIGFLGSEKGKGAQVFIQNFSGAPPRAVGPEGVLFTAVAPDWRRFAVNGFDRPWALYSSDGKRLGPFPLTAHDYPVHWNADGRSILVLDPSDPLGPIQKVDIATGQRKPYIDALGVSREGLVHRMISSFSEDERCYTYNADWDTSTLFLVEADR
jgi:hypothetical protein